MGQINSKTTASMALVLGGALWGIIWIPLRALGDIGLAGIWPGMVLYLSAAITLFPIVLFRWRILARQFRALAICGLLTGAAFSLYSTSVLLTDVVRALLLFYLTPLWGTILGVLFLGERLTLTRAIALLLAFTGLLIVLGAGVQFPWPQNIGDVLALGSGICWAAGSLALYKLPDSHPIDTGISFIFGALFITALFLLLNDPTLGQIHELSDLGGVVKYMPLAAIYIVPMILLTIWPAMLLSPGRVGLLLMSDALVGVISAALLAGEPFGWRELIGTVLIVGAALIDLLGDRRMVAA